MAHHRSQKLPCSLAQHLSCNILCMRCLSGLQQKQKQFSIDFPGWISHEKNTCFNKSKSSLRTSILQGKYKFSTLLGTTKTSSPARSAAAEFRSPRPHNPCLHELPNPSAVDEYNVVKTTINHPPVITIFVDGMLPFPNGWFITLF